MSSHHIVREKQEPALFIQDFCISDEWLGQLLEWSPTLIIAENNYEQMLSLNIKIDVVLSTNPLFTPLQAHTKVWCFDTNCPQKVIETLMKEHYPALNIIAESPDLNLIKNYSDKINIAFINNTSKTYLIKSGFSNWKTKDSLFYIFPENSMVQTQNLTKENNGYKVVKDGFITFNFETKDLIIKELL